jgi:hypothetical protein
MSLYDQARSFLKARGMTVEEKGEHFLLATLPGGGIGGEDQVTGVWVLTRDQREGRHPTLLEEKYTTRFSNAASRYRAAHLYLLVDTREGLSQDFQRAARQHGVKIHLPVWFFDLPFKSEVAPDTRSAFMTLVREAEGHASGRVPQAYRLEGADKAGQDLLPDLAKEIEDELRIPEPRIWFIVAPAGYGKSVFFAYLVGKLYKTFRERHKAGISYPRPLPMIAEHLREAAGANLDGLIDAFLRTDIAAAASRELFAWTVENRTGIFMLDGLDEVITRDQRFLSYLEDRVTAPGSRALIVISVRDSLFESNDELAAFLEHAGDVARTYRLDRWDRRARRVHAWLRLAKRPPRDGEPDPPEVAHYLRGLEENPTLRELAATPYYAELAIATTTEAAALPVKDRADFLDHAITAICRREYGKGTLPESVFPPDAFREWLEELAVMAYQAAGFSPAELRELAELAEVLAARQLSEEEELSEEDKMKLVSALTMTPLVTRSATSGRLQLTHEILAEYLAGCRFAREFAQNPGLFASRLSQRPWTSDSVLFEVLSHRLRDKRDELTEFWGVLSSDGRRNLVQLLLTMPNGDEVLHTGRVLIEGVRLAGVRFADANLDGVSLRACDLTNAVFTRVSLRGAQFEGAVLDNTTFDVQPDALAGASFGDCEHFGSVVLPGRRRVTEPREFLRWVNAQEPAGGPCPSARQLSFLFRKFVYVDGQPRRDELDRRGLCRGRREPGAPGAEDCVDAAIQLGYLEERSFGRVGRPRGQKYGEIVTFVKNGQLSPGLRSLLDALCRIPGCRHGDRS